MMWFDDFAVEKAEFSYVEGSRNGPENWGRLRSKWVACSKGAMQSPIDIIHGNLGWEKGSAGGIHINGTQFVLGEFHWHSPYEHSLDAFVSRYDLEMQMVHCSADGRIAVVAVIYKVGLQDHSLLKEFEKNARPIQPLNQGQAYIFKNES
ncbi:hypothetical protein AMTRI_Chr04g186430 [Amborella trichopoda]